MLDLEVLQFAFKNLKTQKLRSYLTLTGIIIGIATIAALLALAQGLNKAVQEQFLSMGLDVIMIEPGSQSNMLATAFSKLRDTDAKIIEGIPGVEEVFEFFETSGTMTKKGVSKSVFLIGVKPEQAGVLEEIGFGEIENGRNLQQGDSYSIVIMKGFAEKAFESELKVRQSVEIKGRTFKIVGISKETALMSAGMMSNMVLMPQDALKQLYDVKEPTEIMVKANSTEIVPKVQEKIEKELEKNHGKKDFYTLTSEQAFEIASTIIGLIQLALLGIAAISLIVGGIGIMNTMLMTVTERTREIGIMKAIGATNPQILTLFLTESAILGLIGGIIGTILGFGAALLISSVSTLIGFQLLASLPLELALAVLGFAMIVGIISGIAPAFRAARMQPTDALRIGE